MNKIESMSIIEFVKEILNEDIDNNTSEPYALITRWSKEQPYWHLFITYDGKDGQRYFGGDFPLKAANIDEIADLFTLFANEKRKIILDTKGYFSTQS